MTPNLLTDSLLTDPWKNSLRALQNNIIEKIVLDIPSALLRLVSYWRGIRQAVLRENGERVQGRLSAETIKKVFASVPKAPEKYLQGGNF